ncbi:Peptidoglycan-N-acetylglucosamine deacetylase [compost metagenome]
MNSNKIHSYVMKKIKGNDIILMHDTYKPSVDAAIKIINELEDQGYTFVTVSELIASRC